MEGSPVRRLLASLMLVFAASAQADSLVVTDNAPERYTVVKGDTLWDISAKFLKNPWLWPKLWGMNRDEIRNPHWIYPGDVVVFDRANMRLTLQKGDKSGMQNVKLSPGAREVLLGDDAIPAIPMSAIHPFLVQPRVVEAGAFDNAPFVLGNNSDEKVILGTGDVAYATGGPEGVTRWNLLRPGRELIDPETGDDIGVEVEYLGDARTLVPGAPQKILITRAVQEVMPKDKMVASDDDLRFDFQPHAPEQKVNGRIVVAYGGVSETGLYQTVLINRGAKDGLEPGHVLAVYREGLAVKLDKDTADNVTWVDNKSAAPANAAWLTSDVRCLQQGKEAVYSQSQSVKDSFRNTCLTADDDDAVKLPDSRSGLVMVYRVFDHAAYALIMESHGPVYLLDSVRNP